MESLEPQIIPRTVAAVVFEVVVMILLDDVDFAMHAWLTKWTMMMM